MWLTQHPLVCTIDKKLKNYQGPDWVEKKIYMISSSRPAKTLETNKEWKD